MKTFTTTRFAIFCNSFIGETKTAESIEQLLESKMLERQKKSWSCIKYKDSQGRTITITQDYISQGMTIPEIIEDHIKYGDIEEEILCLNPRGSGTITI